MARPFVNVDCVRCAVCNKPVDYWEVAQDVVNGGVSMLAKCHGATDKAFVRDWDIPREHEVVELVAFTTKELTNEQSGQLALSNN